MPFCHDHFPSVTLTDETGPNGRFYLTPDGGRYPSVTTVLGWNKGTKWLQDWRKKVGDEEANFIVGQACVRGSAVHELAERYICNESDWDRGAMPSNLDSFSGIKRMLDRHIGIIKAVEYPLYSDVLRTAGRTDLIAEFDGVLSVIDFKTSRGRKTEQTAHSYFLQKTCYALMIYERLGIKIDQIVTMMAVDHDNPILWVKRRRDFDAEVREIFITKRAEPPVLSC